MLQDAVGATGRIAGYFSDMLHDESCPDVGKLINDPEFRWDLRHVALGGMSPESLDYWEYDEGDELYVLETLSRAWTHVQRMDLPEGWPQLLKVLELFGKFQADLLILGRSEWHGRKPLQDNAVGPH